MTQKNPDGTTTIFEQKVDGRFIRSRTLDKNGALKFTDSLEYDQAGNVIGLRRTKTDGSVWAKRIVPAQNGTPEQSRFIGKDGQATTAEEFDK